MSFSRHGRRPVASRAGLSRALRHHGVTLTFLAILTAAPPALCAQVAFVRSDTTTDGTLDLTDPIRTLLFLFAGGDAPECLDAADADDSGALDLTDAIYTLGYLFLGGPAPPAPGPFDCGLDPTADDLDCASFPACTTGGEMITIGPDGGRFALAGGLVLDVPVGAIAEPTEVIISPLPTDALDEDLNRASFSWATKRTLGGFRAEPDGLAFAEPIIATLPVDPLTPGAIPVQMGIDPATRRTWLAPTALEYSPDEGTIRAEIHHFSDQVFAEASAEGGLIAIEVSDIPVDDPCRSGRIFVRSAATDFESAARDGSCTIVVDDVLVQFLDCPGSPTETVRASEIHGDACDLTVTITPSPAEVTQGCGVAFDASVRNEATGTTDAIPVLWSTLDPSVATVTATRGIATGVRPGIATIEARTGDPRFTARSQLTVRAIELPEEAETVVGQTEFLLVEGVACPDLRWESSDPDVAVVLAGAVSGMSRGIAEISVFDDAGGCGGEPCATTRVTVLPDVGGVWNFTENVTLVLDGGADGTGPCTVTGRIRIVQSGSRLSGEFEETGSCTVTTPEGDEFEIELDTSGGLRGAVGVDFFSVTTESEEGESCGHDGSLDSNRPTTVSGPVECSGEDDQGPFTANGSYTLTRTAAVEAAR